MILNERAKRFDENAPLSVALSWVETIVLAVFVVVILFTFVFKIVVIVGSSMENTLFENDRLIISHMLYKPDDGDIVVADSEVLNEVIVKRIIAVANEVVTIDYENNTVKVDGEIIDEPYIKEQMIDGLRFGENNFDKDKKVYTYTVPFGHVFVMGDNRNHSSDSREIGVIPEDDILGRVIYRFYSEKDEAGKVS